MLAPLPNSTRAAPSITRAAISGAIGAAAPSRCGWIVFRQLADRLEQARALGVVEVLGRQRLALGRQARQRVVEEGRGRRRRLAIQRAHVVGQADFPVNAQRWAGWKKLADGDGRVAGRGLGRSAPQDHLVDHELAVVLAQRARAWLEARIGEHSGLAVHCQASSDVLAQPLPFRSRDGGLPLGLGRRPAAAPGGEGGGLVVADVADGRVQVDSDAGPTGS